MLIPDDCRDGRQLASLPCFVLLACFILWLASCGRRSEPGDPPLLSVSAIVVEPAQLALQAGAEAQLAAQANDAAGQPIGGASFRYTAADPDVLKVSNRGLVTALGPVSAETHVTVASDSAEFRVPVVVEPGPPQRSELLSGDGQTLRAGETPAQPLTARFLDAWGNPIPQLTVLVEPAVAAMPPSEVISDADGVARIEIPAITQAGDVVVALRVEGSGAPVATFRLQVAPDVPAKLGLASGPTEASSDQDSSTSIALRVSDRYDNPISDVEIQGSLSKSDKTPLLARTDATGTAVFTLPPASASRPVTFDALLVDTPSIRASFVLKSPPQ